MGRSGFVFVAALAALAGTARADGLDLPAQEKTLGNGLKVVVLEDHSIPNVAINIWWRVGARNERTGITGLAHFFEHMMFRGGAKYGKTFDVEMEAAGGNNNAFTTQDVTVYQDWIPAAALPLTLDMERDRMSGMVFDPEAVQAELRVVFSEYESGREEPGARVSEAMRGAAYLIHPYHWDTIGYETDILNWQQEDLERFYAENYAPNNATIVIVGDVTTAAAFAEVEKALGGVPRKPERRPVLSVEPEQQGERRVAVEDAKAMLPQVKSAWHICATTDPDFAIWEIVEDVLLDGEAARLKRILIQEEDLCSEVSGGWQNHQFDPSLFTVELTMREGVATEKGEARVYAELAKLAAEGPTAKELERVKNKIEAETVRRLATIDDKAALLGETETFFGGWRNVGKRIADVRKVTAEDVKRVAAKAFTARNRTVGTLVLTGKPPSADPESEQGGPVKPQDAPGGGVK